MTPTSPEQAGDGSGSALSKRGSMSSQDGEYLADFFENGPLGLHSVAPDGTILKVNRAELDLLGYAEQEYVGRNIREFHADPDVIEDILGRLARGELLRGYSARMLAKDGSIKHISIDSSSLQRHGEFVHTRCFMRDITGQREAVTASNHLAAIVESSDDAILSKDLNGIIQSWNQAAERMFGYTPEEAIGRSIRMLIPPERQFEEDEVLSRVRRGDRVEHFETIRRRKDGSLFPISLSVSPIRDSSGRIIGASKIARDITAAKAAENEFLRVQAERAEIMASVVDCVLTTDPAGVIRDFNPAAEAAFGYSRAEAIGRNVADLLLVALVTEDGTTHRGWNPRDNADLASGVTLELIARRASGTEFPVELRLSGGPGSALYTAIFHDISERRALEEAIQESIAAKDEFLSLVSHELRTPIAIIVGNGEILLRRSHVLSDADKTQSLEDIVVQSERLQRIIENLLLLTKMDSSAQFELEPVQAQRVTEMAIAEASRRAPEHRISGSISPDVPLVLSEPTLLKLLIDNLISNAVKYSDPGSSIDVTLCPNARGEVEVHVLDRGLGLSDEECVNVFAPFYRSRSAADRAAGMGLGLTVCQRIVEAQGGWIRARPRPGGGSDFGFGLPAAVEA